MARVITFSTRYPAYHYRKGEPTYFVEKFLNSLYHHKEIPYSFYTTSLLEELNLSDIHEPKHHTIRVVKKRKWKAGDMFSPRVWGNDVNPKSGRRGAYHSKQIIIAPDTKILKVWDVDIWADNCHCHIGIAQDDQTVGLLSFGEVAKNDGLTFEELKAWFQLKPNKDPIKAQILCWNTETVDY